MYSFLLSPTSSTPASRLQAEASLLARIKGDDEYKWFRYNSRKVVTVYFRGKPIEITRGTKFGIRPSSNGKTTRLVFPGDLTRVITVDLPTVEALSVAVTPTDPDEN